MGFEIQPFLRKKRAGRAKTRAIERPHIRCVYSQKKMFLKPFKSSSRPRLKTKYNHRSASNNDRFTQHVERVY